MSVLSLSFKVSVHTGAAAPPLAVLKTFREHPHNANVMAAHTEIGPDPSANLWVVGWMPSETTLSVAFVIAVTNGWLGTCPIFIFTPLPTASLTLEFVRPSMLAMVRKLHVHVPPERVFSVFALDLLSEAFASIWTMETGIQLARDPIYYHARLMCCDNETFKVRETPVLPGVTTVLRRAVASDAGKVATLCRDFAAGSAPFVLSEAQADLEARVLIREGQVWVYEIEAPEQRAEIVSIVATARIANNVAAITKVYTNTSWRSQGCAERLTRYVCEQMLKDQTAVVLYVAHNNPAASAVYRKVGFVSFATYSKGAMTDSWKELGFDRSLVEMGQW